MVNRGRVNLVLTRSSPRCITGTRNPDFWIPRAVKKISKSNLCVVNKRLTAPVLTGCKGFPRPQKRPDPKSPRGTPGALQTRADRHPSQDQIESTPRPPANKAYRRRARAATK